MLTIAEAQTANYQENITSAKLRISCLADFTDDDGMRHISSPKNFFLELDCTVADNTITIPEFDHPVPAIQYLGTRFQAVLYDNYDNQITHFLTNYQLIPNETTTTWESLRIHNSAVRGHYGFSGYLNQGQIQALINEGIENVVFDEASKTEKGVTKLDVAPASASNPVAVGANSPRVAYTTNTLSTANDLMIAGEALSALGGGTLTVKGECVLTDDYTMPETVELDFADGGTVTVSDGKTLIIRKMKPQGARFLFNTNSTGNVHFARGAVKEINLSWYAGIEEATDIADAINKAFSSLSYSFGGNLLIPNQYYLIRNATNPLPLNSHVYGAGRDATKITVNSDYAFKISDLCEYSSIGNLTFEGEGSNIGILFEGDYPNSAKNIWIENIKFSELQIGVAIQSASVVDWEAMNIDFKNCVFSLCVTCAKIATVNSGINVRGCLFYPFSGGKGLEVEKVGSLHLHAPIAFGSATIAPNVPPTDGSIFLEVSGQHNLITVTGCQEENFQYFLKTSGADYRQGIIALSNNLIQSEINLGADRTILSEGNLYVAIATSGDDALVGTYTDASGAISFVYSKGDYFENRQYGTPTILATNKTNKFVGDSTFIEHTNNITGTFTRSGFNRFLLPSAFWGQSKPPVEVLNDEGTGLLLRLGEPDASGNFQNGYDVVRSTTDGILEFNGNQSFPNKGIRTNGYMFAELIQLVASGTRPTANATNRGMLWLNKGGSGVADTLQACLKESGGTYAWKNVTVT